MSLLSIFDEMVENEKILHDQNQDLQMLIKMTNFTFESSKRRNDKLNGSLKEADKKIRNLEQLVRTLKIQLEEEREANADLDIENIKLKKKIQGLQSSLESVNNNFYGNEEADKLLMSITDSSMDSEATLLGDDLCSSDIKLLSETTMNKSPLGYDSTTIWTTSTPAIVVNNGQSNESTKFPFIHDTCTKARPRTASSENYTKKGRRRSKSVDLHIGEKTIISPSLCDLCVSRPTNAKDDSPALPWCPHSQTHVSMNVTPARSLLKPNGCLLPASRIPFKPETIFAEGSNKKEFEIACICIPSLVDFKLLKLYL